MIANRIRMRKKSKGDTWDGIFADPEVGRVLKSKGVIADANKSSIEELAIITSLNPGGSYNTGYFYNNQVITKFPELQYCTGLSDLNRTFRDCFNLTEAIIPEGVTDMTATFYNCTSIVTAPIIPGSVTVVEWTFYGCSSLINAPIIPNSVTNMNETFNHCTSLDGIFVIEPVNPPTYYLTFRYVNVVAIYVPDESVNTYKTRRGWSDHSSKIYPMSELPV